MARNGMLILSALLLLSFAAVVAAGGKQPEPTPMTRAECWDLHCACLVLEGNGDGISDDARRLAAERIRDMMRRLRPRGGWLND